MRIAILAGVSTDAQVKDKASIPDQVQFCRAYIKANNAAETAGPYIMDGYSRTGYDSLEVAMREIPPLAQAINETDKYDILLMDNFDRLGDLGFIVKTRFKKLHKQLHSARQSGKFIPPEKYDPYSDDSGDISMHVEGIIQTYRINKLRRGWNIGIPERARVGLPPLGVPYGYKIITKNEPPALLPDRAELLVSLKDQFLSGTPLTTLAQFAQDSGLPPMRGDIWHSRVIGGMLVNPFYAGQTIFGKSKCVNGIKIPVPQSQWVIGTGRHTPIWDIDTHYSILAENNRRRGMRVRVSYHALTGLLHCPMCGAVMHHHGHSQRWVYLRCNIRGHVSYRYQDALETVAAGIADQLATYSSGPRETVVDNQAEIKRLQSLRLKVQEGFEANLYTPAEAGAKISRLESEIHRLQSQHQRQAQQDAMRRETLKIIDANPAAMRQFILTGDPSLINRLLHTMIQGITITPQNEVQIEWL